LKHNAYEMPGGKVAYPQPDDHEKRLPCMKG